MSSIITIFGRLILLLYTAQICHAQTKTATQIYQFPPSPFTDIENVAIRPNGELLLTTITSPSVYLLNPNVGNASPQLLHTFPGATSTLGIVQTTASDVYAVVVGNYSTTTFQGIPGSFSVWSIALNGPTTIKKIASIATAEALNGMTIVPANPAIALIADSTQGVVYSLNVNTGAYQVAIQSPDFKPNSTFPLGINGVRTSGSTLYFTNSAQGLFGKVPITSAGLAAGPVTVVAHAPSGDTYDDFALDRNANAYVAAHPQSLLEIQAGGAQTTILDASNIYQPTSAVFGAGGCTLYVVTAGSGETGESGQVLSVNTC